MRRRRLATLLGVVLALVVTGAARAGPIEDALALSRADRRADAEAVLASRIAAAPDDDAARVALGDVQRLRCRLALAEASYRVVIDRHGSDPGARAGLGEVLLLEGRPLEALAQTACALPPLVEPEREDARPWRVRALALVELRRYDLAVASAKRAVALAPADARIAEALAAAQFRAGDMDAARDSYERATQLDPRTEEANLRLGNGFGPASAARTWRDGEESDWFAVALASWDAQDLGTAERTFLRLVRERPEAYKYRLGLGLVRLSARRRQEGTLGGDATALYAMLEAPAVKDLEKVVRGYAALPPLEQLVVRVATAPAAPFWPSLVEHGAVHDLIPLSADLTDDPLRGELEPQRTQDGRWYAHLRGVGGVHAATGVEKLREAAEFAFHTFAHEFGHQVHRHGLSQALQREVDALYAKAGEEGRYLDYYAASNVDEYFAQGYEAFVSPMKRGCLTETARHTRDELASKDRPLYDFLWRTLDTSYERPERFAALRAAASASDAPKAEPAER